MLPFSRRLSWLTPPNPLYSLQEAKRQSGSPVIDLTGSNPTTSLNDYPHSKIQAVFQELSDFSYRPQSFGSYRAREAVSDYYRHRGLDIPAERLMLTASTSEAYTYIFMLLCDPGDEVLVPVPSYPLFDYLTKLCGVRVSPYLLRYDGAWHIDFEDLDRAIAPSAKAIVVVNPGNPTGNFLHAFDSRPLLSMAAKHGLSLIVDEVFTDYPLLPSARTSLAGNTECLTFSLNGLSKSCGMPQMKVAWTAISGEESSAASASQGLELIADTYLSVNTPVQAAIPKLLDIGEEIRVAIQQRLASNLSSLDALLASSPVTRLYLEGGWSAILQLPAIESQESHCHRLLRDHDVLTQPGYFFDLQSDAYLVLSLLTPLTDLREGVRRICRYASTLS